MSIIHAFDNQSKPLIDVEKLYRKAEFVSDVCIVSFSCKVKEMFLRRFPHDVVGKSCTANGDIDIYSFTHEGKKFLFYMSPIGAAVAATLTHEVNFITGAKKFIFFGSCGVLDRDVCRGKLIVPTEAYRDEGISYHYCEPTDYIRLKNAERIAGIFTKCGYPFVMGKTWTTDAFFMETVNKTNARKNEGCLTVEMEAAGLQAVCDHYGYELFDFLFGADLLDGGSWDRRTLGNEEEFDLQIKAFEIALKIAGSV